MRAKGRSLTVQLAWRLIVLQVVIMLGLIVALTYSLYGGGVSYIREKVPLTVLQAVHADPAVGIALVQDRQLHQLYRSEPGLWFAVADENGHALVHGDIPAVYRPLVASLARLEPSEVHVNRAPYALTMRVYVGETPQGRMHVMVGGAASTDTGEVFMMIGRYLGWRITLPLALVTLILLPWLIRRAMSGVAEVAAQAQAINIEERGARLAARAVPRELQPMVQAFNAALERLNEGYDARDRFLAGAAHELRAPIAILGARVETLDAGPERTRLLADVARLSNLAEQLLDLQRLDENQGQFEPVDLVALAREVAADVAPLVVDAGYELALDAAPGPVTVTGDRLSLSRVLTNLIQNAIAYGGEHGCITVDVGADASFGVSDQGPGIPLEERQRIFEPFYRLRPSSTGTGLGLHLVGEIVALHGGRIEVAEAHGGGAWFRVHLPALSAVLPAAQVEHRGA